MNKLHKRDPAGKWQAYGSKESKKLFLAELIKRDIKCFSGKQTALKIIQDGSLIKNIDVNRKQVTGSFVISSEWPTRQIKSINLDLGEIKDHVHFILTGEALV